MFGGLAIFVYALQTMSAGLQELGGKKANKIMESLTSMPFKGMLFGAGVTAILQSSTLVTVMVVSLVNTTMLTLKQAASVIMGANVGTTLTAQLVAFTNLESFSITNFWVYFAAVGITIYFVVKKRSGLKTSGLVLFSFAMLLLGLALMSDAMRPLRDNAAFMQFMVVLSNNRLLGLLAGAVFTAIVQSSTAATTVVISMTVGGLIQLDAALPLILGANVGTCLTAVLASIGGTVSAKRAAAVHVLFNLVGALVFLVFIGPFETIVLAISPYYDVPRQAANAHLLFSVIATMLFMPFINQLVTLVTKIVPGSDRAPSKDTVFLEWRVVNNPPVAITLAQQELLRMGELAGENIRLSIEGFLTKNKKKIKLMKKQEKLVDRLEKEIVRYLVRMAQERMGAHISVRHAGLLHAANDIERVSDHARNISRLAERAIENELSFTGEDLERIEAMYNLVVKIYNTAVQAVRENTKQYAANVKALATQIDSKGDEIRAANIQHMAEGECSSESGMIVADIVANLERVSDHSKNISHLPQGKL